MGRPARNYGGTLGHGCLPLPGETPNFNRHVLEDKKLQRLVSKTIGNKRSITKLATKSDKSTHSIDNHGTDPPTLSKGQGDAYTIKEKQRINVSMEPIRIPSRKPSMSKFVKKSKRANTSECIKELGEETLDTINPKSNTLGYMKEASYSDYTRDPKHMPRVKQTVASVEFLSTPKTEPLSSMRQPRICAKQSSSSDPERVGKKQLLKSYKVAQFLPTENSHKTTGSQSVSCSYQPEISSFKQSQTYTEQPVVCLKDQLKLGLSVAQEQKQQQVMTPEQPYFSQKPISTDKPVLFCQQPSNSLTSYLSPVISFWYAPTYPQATLFEFVCPFPYFGPIQNVAEVNIQSTKDQFIPTNSQNAIQSNKIVPLLD